MARSMEAQIKVAFYNQLVKELKMFKSDIGNYLAGEVTKRLSNAASNAIYAFYDDYDPVLYKRHGYFIQHGFKPYRNSNNAAGRYYGGIRLTPELFPDNAYKEDKYKVYGMVMGCVIDPNADDPVDYNSIYALGGYHGPYSLIQNDPPPMRPDPMTLIFEELDNIYLEQDALIKKAVKYSKHNRQYKLLKF